MADGGTDRSLLVAVLEFEASLPQETGTTLAGAIRNRFGCSIYRYNRMLDEALGLPEAEELAPVACAARRRARMVHAHSS